MRKTNYHTHTKRCMHASGKDEDYVLAAIQNGYEELGFSDHTPWHYESDYVAHMRMKENQLNDYLHSIRSLKEKYKEQISIKIGLECEYFPKYMDWLKHMIVEKEIDYIILGNHYYKTDEDRIYFGTACEDNEMLQNYVNEAIEGMRSGLYAYIAHPDLFMRGKRIFDAHAKAASYQLCQAAKTMHIPLEYNLAGAMYNDVMHTMQYPHDEFWKIAAEVGNTGIIGVDAHEPAALLTDKYYNKGIDMFEKHGISYTDSISFFHHD